MPDAPLREPSRSGGAPARGKQRGRGPGSQAGPESGAYARRTGTGQARESGGDCGNFAVMTEARPLPQPPPARGGGFARSPSACGRGLGEGVALARAEPLLAFLLALAFYASLYARLPYHDVARFVAQIESNRFVWDIGHIFLQPATLLWHRWLGFGETAVMSQKHINSFATAAAIGIFYALLMRLRLPAWQRILAAALLAGSCSVITLAPTGHMKLLAFPFINAGLYALVVWEQRLAAGERCIAAPADPRCRVARARRGVPRQRPGHTAVRRAGDPGGAAARRGRLAHGVRRRDRLRHRLRRVVPRLRRVRLHHLCRPAAHARRPRALGRREGRSAAGLLRARRTRSGAPCSASPTT